jgi:23S rRNA (pseudouridine1915-N3)-methyltransferase
MKITLLVVGKSNNLHLQKLEEVYRDRLKHYTNFDILVIPELKNTKNLSENEQKEREVDLILKVIDNHDEVVLLDEKGREFSSVAFSDFIEKKILNSTKSMVFVVGGPYGFSQKMYDRANSKLSLSAMTFSHQMIRVIFIEQLYRAFTILRGEPYHHS